jgi:hypothetical protein
VVPCHWRTGGPITLASDTASHRTRTQVPGVRIDDDRCCRVPLSWGFADRRAAPCRRLLPDFNPSGRRFGRSQSGRGAELHPLPMPPLLDRAAPLADAASTGSRRRRPAAVANRRFPRPPAVGGGSGRPSRGPASSKGESRTGSRVQELGGGPHGARRCSARPVGRRSATPSSASPAGRGSPPGAAVAHAGLVVAAAWTA